MSRIYTRRGFVSAVAALAASGALANAPERSVFPRARPAVTGRLRPQSRPSLANTIARAGVSGTVGVVLADAETGEIIEAHQADDAVPPASVTKAVTALYAIDALGVDHRFETRVLATAEIVDGVLDGDLILAGGGDPNLLTDDLATLAERVKVAGLKEVRGQFLVYDDALPNLDEIDESQLDHLGYNPAISGLNLNFNRVHFEWKRAGASYDVTMDARSETYRPAVSVSKMRVVDRDLPIYAYREVGDTDHWTVAKRALGNAGSRWLPVRQPSLYAAEVFATFCRSHGVVLTPAKIINDLPAATQIARFDGLPLEQLMRSMLRFSTNITAEAAGLAASATRTGRRPRLRTSAQYMTRWVTDRAGQGATFTDHSGLADTTRISAAQMVRLLVSDGVQARLRPILKVNNFVDDKGRKLAQQPGLVVAKTGTLNFVTSLAGYVTGGDGRQYAFAIFGADLEARERGKRAGDEQPAGSISYNRKVKKLQQALLRQWVR